MAGRDTMSSNRIAGPRPFTPYPRRMTGPGFVPLEQGDILENRGTLLRTGDILVICLRKAFRGAGMPFRSYAGQTKA